MSEKEIKKLKENNEYELKLLKALEKTVEIMNKYSKDNL